MIQCFAPKVRKSDFEDSMSLQLISASKMDFNYKSHHPRILHKHERFLEVLYVRSGTGVYIVDNQRYNISTGDVIINNANTLHDEDPNNSSDLNMYCVIVTGVSAKGFPLNCLVSADASPVFPAEEYAGTMNALMSMIYTLLSTKPTLCVETCYHLTTALLALLLALMRKRIYRDGKRLSRSNRDIIAAKVKNYIDSHYDERFTLEDIGREVLVSQYYLAHAFKQATGFSPMQYAIRRRLGEAQSLLIMTNKPITEIALSIGFGSLCHFNTMFNKYIGMTPSEYQKTYSNHSAT